MDALHHTGIKARDIHAAGVGRGPNVCSFEVVELRSIKQRCLVGV